MDGTQCLLNVIVPKRCFQDLFIALKSKNVGLMQIVIIESWLMQFHFHYHLCTDYRNI